MKTQKQTLKLNAGIKELNILKMNTINGGTSGIFIFNGGYVLQPVLIDKLNNNPINYDSNHIFQ